MKTLLVILLAALSALIVGCRSTERPGHNWRPPGMLMQAPQEKGSL